jgi:hypothetical protein
MKCRFASGGRVCGDRAFHNYQNVDGMVWLCEKHLIVVSRKRFGRVKKAVV